MAAISVPNEFTNGTAADATEVNANFDAITDGLSDGTKDITVSAATINGALTANGAVTLGNATGDDIIVTGRVAADFDPKTASTYDMGDATQLWKGVYANDAFMDIGAVGTPSHTFHADTNTGMYSTGADTLDFATGGTLALTLDSSQDLTSAGHIESKAEKSGNYQVEQNTTTTLFSELTAPTANGTFLLVVCTRSTGGAGSGSTGLFSVSVHQNGTINMTLISSTVVGSGNAISVTGSPASTALGLDSSGTDPWIITLVTGTATGQLQATYHILGFSA